jgi:hypothetical protein
VPDTESVRHIEMTWRCTSCQTQNLGRYKKCQACGHPKDGSERYEMPADPSKAASVTDADLLRMASAGPDWRCAYCESDQRRADGSCSNCGASAVGASEVPDEADAPIAVPGRRKLYRNVGIGAGVTAALAGGLVWNAKRARDYDATVTAVAWEQVIEVERYAIRDREGFKETIPAGAMDVVSLGSRVHHQEQVFDHNETEHYTEQVPDGYRSESYTERVSCGQDCTSTPKTCRESCTSSKNGFAKCKTTCSGGGRSCTTRYCSESRTRQVPKTRTESRTRQVPRYRSEPRYAEAFHWRAWEWGRERTVRSAGAQATGLIWATDKGARHTGLPEGEQEREQRHAKYTVTLEFHGETIQFAVPGPDQLAPFTTGSHHDVHRDGDTLAVDGTPIQPLPAGAP